MRVLWVDADENPWTDAGGWQLLEEFGVRAHRVSHVEEARELVARKEFDVLLVRAELEGAPALLVQARKSLTGQKIVLASSEWSKEQFKVHSKTAGAAHRYARVPMPPEGFLGLVADLLDCTVEELRDYVPSASSSPSVDIMGKSGLPPLPKLDRGEPAAPKRKKKIPVPDSDDTETLRKYLRIKEEQLEIAEGEREELSLENERIQKDAHQLQVRLRELEHLNDELVKKLQHVDGEKESLAQEKLREADEHELKDRSAGERMRNLEAQLGEANEKYENLRVRVRKDIRKIRENERDLEARLELLRKDSETLLQARDDRVLEMQRKIDALEFDLDQVQDGRVQAQMEAERYLAKLSRVSRALQVAVGMIEDDHVAETELADLEPLVGGAATADELDEAAAAAPAPAEPPAGAETPPAEEASLANGLPEADDLSALAENGEATQMISRDGLDDMGEPESSSG